MPQPWVEKYRPKKLDEIVGQKKAIESMRRWAEEWKKGRPKKPSLLLYGPPGTGKSSAAVALASEMGWDLVELNASDKRAFGEISRIAGSATTMGSLTGLERKRLVVLDEADNIHGKEDRGGYRAISTLLSQTSNPIVLIANERYEIPEKIRRMSLEIAFRRLDKRSIARVLGKICETEGVKADPRILEIIAGNSENDLRSAINDLQGIAEGRKELKVEDIVSGARDRGLNVFQAIEKLLRARSCKEAQEVLWALDRPPDDAIDWISENVPRMLVEPADLAQVYEMLSRADIFLGRVRKRQAYGMWRYASTLMSAGVALSHEGGLRFRRFQPPSSGMMYRWTGSKRKLRSSVAEKIARSCHTSSREAVKNYLPYLAVIFKTNKRAAERIAKELELGEEEVEFLRSSVIG